jgi:hypothetical protein
VITDSTISGNKAGEAGGISNAGTETITDSTVSGNGTTESNSTTGGIVNYGTQTILGSTISGNSASDTDGGILVDGGTTTMGGTIVAANTAQSDDNCENVGGTFVSVGYNLTNDSTGAACGFTKSTDLVEKSPDLTALSNAGGPTLTMQPEAGSPAIGVIPVDTTLDGTQVCPRDDQRGVPSRGSCTIGAVEVTGTGDFFTPYWSDPGVGCSGPPSPGFSIAGPNGCGSSTTGEGVLAYNYLAGPENGNPGSSFTYTWVVPPGYEDQIMYAIPSGGFLNNGKGTITLDGRADGHTAGKAASGKTCTKATFCKLFKSRELQPGSHQLTVTSVSDYVNIYGVWVTQKVS